MQIRFMIPCYSDLLSMYQDSPRFALAQEPVEIEVILVGMESLE